MNNYWELFPHQIWKPIRIDPLFPVLLADPRVAEGFWIGWRIFCQIRSFEFPARSLVFCLFETLVALGVGDTGNRCFASGSGHLTSPLNCRWVRSHACMAATSTRASKALP